MIPIIHKNLDLNLEWQFVFAGWVWVVSMHEYKAI